MKNVTRTMRLEQEDDGTIRISPKAMKYWASAIFAVIPIAVTIWSFGFEWVRHRIIGDVPARLEAAEAAVAESRQTRETLAFFMAGQEHHNCLQEQRQWGRDSVPQGRGPFPKNCESEYRIRRDSIYEALR